MRTLLLSPELFLADGGIARVMRLHLKALCEGAAPGDEIHSLVLNDHPAADPRLANYTTPALRQNTGCGRDKWLFIRHALGIGRRCDRIICGHVRQLSLARLARSIRPSLRYFLVAHGIEVWRPFSAIERRALRGAHRILCVSDYTRTQLLRFCPGLDASRLVVVPNTLDPQLAAPPAAVTTVPRRIDGPEILCVGRLSSADAYKGIDTLIEAMPRIRREFPLARLTIVGDGDDRARLQDLALKERVNEACTFTGILGDAELQSTYARCEIFALPSRKEGFGLVFLEAMSHGKPCVGARAGGIPEVVNDRVGALAAYGNIAEIAAAVIDLVRHPRDPAAIRSHVESFAFPAFRQRVAEALAS